MVDDPRVRFFKGLFHETLPTYEWPEREVLVVSLDADLYSSTTIALDHAKDHLRVGSDLYSTNSSTARTSSGPSTSSCARTR